MREHLYVFISFILVIILLSMVSIETIKTEARPSVFTLKIDKDALRMIGYESFVVSSATLSIPGVPALQPTVKNSFDSLEIVFKIPEKVWSSPLKLIKGDAVSSPAISVILTDYNNHKTVNLIIPSPYIIYKNMGIDNITEIHEILLQDPLAAIRTDSLTISSKDIPTMRQLGLIFEINKTFTSNLQLQPWEKQLITTQSCNLGTEITQGIYYNFNPSHPVANEDTPQWWRNRVKTPINGGDAIAWEVFKDRLVAAVYYVSSDIYLNDAITVIANYAYNNELYGNSGPASSIDMDALIRAFTRYSESGWDDSLTNRIGEPIGYPVYSGYIPLFKYQISNTVGTYNSKHILEVIATVAHSESLGVASGMLVNGLFLGATASTNVDIMGKQSRHYMTNSKVGFYVYGEIYTQGDFAVTFWDPIGSIICGGREYTIIVPRTVITPLLTLNMFFSDDTFYMVANETVEEPPTYAPGISEITTISYGPDDYGGGRNVIYNFEIDSSDSDMTLGYNAIIGNPLLRFMVDVYGNLASSTYAGIAVDTAKATMDTGYISASFQGSATLINLTLYENLVPPTENYTIKIVNTVPRALDGIPNVTSLTWDEVRIYITVQLQSPSDQEGSS
ncbi:MAG: hypothetical protein F7C32_02835 [Desulfurococcales archaeon]|nr:hypothetical protein [Desulfurococcales archaeon]